MVIGGFKKLAEAYYMVTVKTCAAQAKKLTQLWCEDQLCGEGPFIPDAAAEFGDGFLEMPQEARVTANKLLLDNTGTSIKAELQRSSKQLKFTDAFFDLETSVFTSLLGEGEAISS